MFDRDAARSWRYGWFAVGKGRVIGLGFFRAGVILAGGREIYYNQNSSIQYFFRLWIWARNWILPLLYALDIPRRRLIIPATAFVVECGRVLTAFEAKGMENKKYLIRLFYQKMYFFKYPNSNRWFCFVTKSSVDVHRTGWLPVPSRSAKEDTFKLEKMLS